MSWCRWVWADLADPVKSLMVAHLLFLFNLPSLSAGRSVQHSLVSCSIPRRPRMERDRRFISQLFYFLLPQSHLLTSNLFLQDIVNAQEKLDKRIYFGFSLLFIFIFYFIFETWSFYPMVSMWRGSKPKQPCMAYLLFSHFSISAPCNVWWIVSQCSSVLLSFN